MNSTVIDLGCYTYPSDPLDESKEKLISEFKPSLYLGFDPNPNQEEYIEYKKDTDTIVKCEQKAAWVFEGSVKYSIDKEYPLRSHINEGNEKVKCFNLNSLLEDLISDYTVLKLDVEGSEYKLLFNIIEANLHHKIDLILVEWHKYVDDYLYPYLDSVLKPSWRNW